MEFQQETKKKKKRILLLIIVGLLLITIILLLLISKALPKGRLEEDSETVTGLLDTGRSAEEIQDTLNTIVDEGRFAVSCNSAMNLKDGKLDVKIENIQGNQYWMQVDVVIQGGEHDGEVIYSSGIVKQGLSIEAGSTDAELPVGFYDALAVFSAIDPETEELVGKTQAYVIVSVPWGEEGQPNA